MEHLEDMFLNYLFIIKTKNNWRHIIQTVWTIKFLNLLQVSYNLYKILNKLLNSYYTHNNHVNKNKLKKKFGEFLFSPKILTSTCQVSFYKSVRLSVCRSFCLAINVYWVFKTKKIYIFLWQFFFATFFLW